MPLTRAVGNRSGEALTLTSLGAVYSDLGEKQQALEYYNQALPISREVGNRSGEATTLNNLGGLYDSLGEKQRALEYYNQALPLLRAVGDRSGEAGILSNLAVLERDQNNLETALTHIQESITILEDLRTKIGSQDLRASFFATVQDRYQFYIDLLMELHEQNPNKGYNAQALHISERSRARGLLELLTEASANIREGVDPQLLAQEQTLLQKLNTVEHDRHQLTSGQYTQEELDALKQQSQDLLLQLDQLEAQIRINSPRYASLNYPQPLTLDEIQQQVLDEDTLLLQYSLGSERSFLWAVTPDGITSYVLPSSADIATAAQAFRQSLTSANGSNISAGEALSQIVLAPVAHQLQGKRLLIVGDGVLQYIPFAALPLPNAPATPLLVQNEIVTLPSASTVAIQRQQLANRSPAPQTLAVLADPIFDPNDTRLTGTPPPPNPDTLNKLALTRAVGSLGLGDIAPTLPRLEYTRVEGEKILALVPDAKELEAFDFQASREIATHPQLSQYQIVHLATHGILDATNPELSGVVLSLFDNNQTPQDGFLRLQDIFNLNLPAELVVLSACQTGLGENVRGEGIVGLTRGFMYAGARRVVVSLWSVNDVATSEVMVKFYQKMLEEQQNPVTALREAQLEMWNSEQWNSPYYWAAFTIQGDWK